MRLFAFALLLVPAVLGFQECPGTACPVAGAPCEYSYLNSMNGTTVVNAICAPNLFCADNGAQCTATTQCFNDCGNGICGGVGSVCNTQDPFRHAQNPILQHTEFICFMEDEPSQIADPLIAPRSVFELPSTFLKNQCMNKGQEACPLQGGGYECVDTGSSLETCGACSLMAGARDCSQISNVNVVECVQGGCKISSCMAGFKVDPKTNECVSIAGHNHFTKRHLMISHGSSHGLAAH
ncbi:hypothetical protein RQP46_009656 [Phenoliferia psychrophenolica]